jgi:hypothetical protein
MSNEETVKLNVHVGLITSVRIYTKSVIDTGETREDWDAMSEDEGHKLGEELYDQWVAGLLDGDWEVAD